MLNLQPTISQLQAEHQELSMVIFHLEKLQTLRAGRGPLPATGKRGGRKSMGARERQEVSERMKRYWASRRQPKKGQATK